jgi:hypothetical protein
MNRDESRRKTPWLLVAGVTIAWVFAVIALYYVVHKPFDLGNVTALLRGFLNILAWLLLLAAAAGLGLRIAGRWLSQVTPLEELTLSVGLGLGLLSLLTLVWGLIGGLSSCLAWPLIAGIALLNATPLRASIRRLRSSPIIQADTRFERLLAGYVCLSLLIALSVALAPPIAWDSQVYHLTGPKLYIERGQITGGIDIPYLGFPQLVEMLFTLGLLLKSPVAESLTLGSGIAQLIHWTYALLALLSAYTLAERYLTRRAGWLAMAILASAPTISLLASWAYVDLAVLFYELAAFQLMLLAWQAEVPPTTEGIGSGSEGRGLLALAGVVSGMAVGVKYTAVLLPAAMAVLVALHARKRGWSLAWRQALLFGGYAALAAAPWFVKNWLLTGNPVYPFFLAGQLWDGYRAWFYSRAGTGLAYTAPWRLLIAPWEATIRGIEGAEGYSATIGPLFLAAIPLLLLVWGKLEKAQRTFIGLAVAVSAPQYLLWLYGVAQSALLIQTRLLFPIFGFLALLAGLALDRIKLLDRPQLSLDRLLSMAVVLVLGIDLLGTCLRYAGDNPLAYLAGWETAEKYLERHQPSYQQAISYLNDQLPESAKVYFLWEPRSFYVQRAVRPDAILDGFLHLRHRFGDAAGIARYLGEQGYTHVLLYKQGMDAIVQAGFDPVTAEDLAVMDDLQARYLSPIQDWDSAYLLYRVTP